MEKNRVSSSHLNALKSHDRRDVYHVDFTLHLLEMHDGRTPILALAQ